MKNYNGVKFGRLTVVREAQPISKTHKKGYNANIRVMECQCECGKITNVRLYSLKNGTTESCGCLSREASQKRKSLIFGVGVNDICETINSDKLTCTAYRYWKGMMRRCYDSTYKKNKASYAECSVCEEWRYFSNFKKWFELNWKEDVMGGWHLDKDLMIKGNKIYSPSACSFVPTIVNNLIPTTKQNSSTKGVTQVGNKYIGTISKRGKNIHLGTFEHLADAVKTHKSAKVKYVREVALAYEKWLHPSLFNNLMSYNGD